MALLHCLSGNHAPLQGIRRQKLPEIPSQRLPAISEAFLVIKFVVENQIAAGCPRRETWGADCPDGVGWSQTFSLLSITESLKCITSRRGRLQLFALRLTISLLFFANPDLRAGKRC